MGASIVRWLHRPSRLRSALIFAVPWITLSLVTRAARSLWPEQVDDVLMILLVVGAIVAVPLVAVGLYRDYGQPPQRR
jgi:hypothetical protein